MRMVIISFNSGIYADKDKFEYKPLWDRLRAIGAVRILFSKWVVADQAGRASAIHDALAPLTLATDRLLAQEILLDAKWDKLLISDAEYSLRATPRR